MADTLGEMLIKIGIVNDDFDKKISQALSSMDKFSRNVDKIGKNLTKTFTIPITGIAVAAFRSSDQATRAFSAFAERTKTIFGQLGDTLVTALRLDDFLLSVSNAIEGAVRWFSNLSRTTQTTISVLAAIAAAIGPLLIVIGKLAIAIRYLITVVITLATTALAHPLIAVVVAAAAAILYFSGAFDTLAKAIAGTNPEMDSYMKKLDELTTAVDKANMKTRNAPGSMSSKGTRSDTARFGAPRVAVARANLVGFIMENSPIGNMVGRIGTVFTDMGRQAGVVLDELANKVVKTFTTVFSKGTTVFAKFAKELKRLFAEIPPLARQMAQLVFDTFQAVTKGIGDAVANAIVYQQDLMDSLVSLTRQVAASLISMAVQIAAAQVAAAIAIGAAWTWTEAIKSLGLLGLAVGAGLALAFIAGAVASSKQGASAGRAAGSEVQSAYTGGLFTRPGITSIAERGPEIVLNRQNVRQFLGGGGFGGTQVINQYLDGRLLSRTVVRGMPRELRLHGVTGG